MLPSIDIIGCKLALPFGSCLVINIYIPPKTSKTVYEELFEFLSEVCLNFDNLFIVGDFNLPDVHDLSDPKHRLWYNLCSFLNLTQFNNIKNASGKLLDFVLTNFDECQVEKEIFPIVNEDSYHPALTINITYKSQMYFSSFPTSSNVKTYNFKKADFPLLYSLLFDIDWSFIENFADVNEACVAFYDKLYTAFDASVLTYKQTKRGYPKWYSPKLRQIIRSKEKFYKKYKKTRSDFAKQNYILSKKSVKALISRDYNFYIRSTENSLLSKPKDFWNYVRDKRGRSRIPNLLKLDETIVRQPIDIVNAFAEYFNSVYMSTPDYNKKQNAGTSTISNCFWPNIDVTKIDKVEVEQAIQQLKPKTSYGCDNIPSFLIKDCRDVFATPLTFLMNLSLSSKVFPNIWKLAKVSPVLKKGDSINVKNYRPISLLSNFSKVFEIVIYNRVSTPLKNILLSSQHGFIKGRSTVTNLLCVTQYLTDALEARSQVDVIYTDMAKAFDRINHQIAIKKLSYCGFSDNITQWFYSYLTDRQQFVSYNGFWSNYFVQKFGVPQGSTLGPLIFAVYVNDITQNINSSALLFADDLKIYREIRTKDDCIILQKDLNKIFDWCTDNLLDINIGKCLVVSYTRKVLPINFVYNCKDQLLTRSDSVKDLGVIFDSKLTFNLHAEYLTTTSYKILGFVIRNCSGFINTHPIISVYNALVRAKLEYASTIWSPYYKFQEDDLERVQRKFLKFLHKVFEGTYPHRGCNHKKLLDMFSFEELKVRREISDIKFLHKLLNNQIDSLEILSFINFNVPQHNVRRPLTFVCPTAKTNLQLKSPIYRITASGNLLRSDIDFMYDSLKKIITCFYKLI